MPCWPPVSAFWTTPTVRTSTPCWTWPAAAGQQACQPGANLFAAGHPPGAARLSRPCQPGQSVSEIGEHRASRQLYQQLVHVLPDHPLIRRNALVSLEYDPDASPAVRRTMAQLWGEWAQARVGGRQPRPPAPALNGRPLRVGYVSADFCQHTVGLLVQDVLRAHNPARVSVFATALAACRTGSAAISPPVASGAMWPRWTTPRWPPRCAPTALMCWWICLATPPARG